MHCKDTDALTSLVWVGLSNPLDSDFEIFAQEIEVLNESKCMIVFFVRV